MKLFEAIVVTNLITLAIYNAQKKEYLFAIILACSAGLHLLSLYRATAPKLSQDTGGWFVGRKGKL